MSEASTRIRAFVASPGDTAEERVRLERVVAELNRGIAEDRGLFLDLVKWETHTHPGIGADAQDVINRQLPTPDLVIGMFWRRVGTPTGRAPSGSAEELERALDQWREFRNIEILVYFNRAEYFPSEADVDQLQQLVKFRAYLQRSGVLVGEYNGADEFEAKVRQHLTGVIRTWRRASENRPSHPAAPSSEADEGESDRHYEQLRDSGSLMAQIDARRRGDVQSIAEMLEAALLDEGYADTAAARARTALTELAVNVGRHTRDGRARIVIRLHRRFGRRVVISVQDEGSGFDLQRVLDAHYAAVVAGQREHGLLRVSRLGRDLHTDTAPDPWTTTVRVDVSEIPDLSSMCAAYPTLQRFAVDHRDSEVYWVGNKGYIGDQFLNGLKFAVEHDSVALLELFLGDIRTDAAYLAVEVLGPPPRREVATDELWLGEVSKSDIFLNAVERFLEPYFSRRRVIVVISGKSPPGNTLARWLRERRVLLVEGADDNARRAALEEILGDDARL